MNRKANPARLRANLSPGWGFHALALAGLTPD